jgi:hypothetical protein
LAIGKVKQMARMNLEGAELYDCTIKSGNRMGVASVPDNAAGIVLGPNSPHVLTITAAAARNVRLPAAPQRGDYFLILNTSAGAFALTIQDSAGGALPVALSIAQSKGAWVVYDGVKWIGFAGA